MRNVPSTASFAKKSLIAVCIACAASACTSHANNLLKNPGFEEPVSTGWKVATLLGNGEPYFYLLGPQGGGHGEGGPHQGHAAVEIYTSSRSTQLSQTIELEAGRYRFSGYVRSQGGFPGQILELTLHGKSQPQTRKLPVVSMAYRQYTADFEVKEAGPHTLSLVVSTGGAALDDLSLTPLDNNAPKPSPALLFDLSPPSITRSQGIQPCLPDQPQWINFTLTSTDPQRLRRPLIHFYVPANVKFFGVNEKLLPAEPAADSKDATVPGPKVENSGEKKYTYVLPSFTDLSSRVFGGAWVRIPLHETAKIRVEIENDGKTDFSQEITLKTVAEPTRQLTPKKIYLVAYHVQQWQQSLEARLEALPRQFRLMGFNVWSDYGLIPHNAPADALQDEEQVRSRAFRDYGVTAFWPNFASFFETAAGSHYPDLSQAADASDIFVTRKDGTLDRSHYNMRYVANDGKAWADSVLQGYIRTLQRPEAAKLPYRNSGFINDGMENMVISYDNTTLNDFAKSLGEAPGSFTVADLNQRLKIPWQSYNLNLYTRCASLWAKALEEESPGIKTAISVEIEGPCQEPQIPMKGRSQWARKVRIAMPQWYGPMKYYGAVFQARLAQTLKLNSGNGEGGMTSLLPVIQVSQGSDLDDPLAVRFKVFDFLSTSSAVKGIAFYIASYTFADGDFMAGFSRANTLLADVEDYYVNGEPRSDLARFVPSPRPPIQIAALDENGQPAIQAPEVETSVRVHTLKGKNRLALLTVISHCNKQVGDKGVIHLSRKFVEKTLRNRDDLCILDHLAGKVIPFSREFAADTGTTANMGLFEIISRKRAHELGYPVPDPE